MERELWEGTQKGILGEVALGRGLGWVVRA